MVLKPIFGNWNSVNILNSLEKYVLISMEEPWNIVKPKLSNSPKEIIFNKKMDINHLRKIVEGFEPLTMEPHTIVGLGGGTACDSAKFLDWYLRKEYDLELDLILIPSIISVDAFLCSSIAIRTENKVKYIGESHPKKIIIDYDLIRKAPPLLNRAGVSDTISITSALGDWKLAREENNELFDQNIFNSAKSIVKDLMNTRPEIREISEKGIKALVDGFYSEVALCDKWGNAHPEEGSEHFLAYCLEYITHNHYIHGTLIGMNVLISLYLQEEYAEFSFDDIRQFFKDIELEITPESQKISLNHITQALMQIKQYVIKEELGYSIFNSPRLNIDANKIKEIINLLKQI